MPSQPDQFVHTSAPPPHPERGRALFRTHPEAKRLVGPNPASFLVTLFVVTLQTGLAFLLRGQPWWLVLIVAYLFGALANHSLFVLIHEYGHNLVFRSAWANLVGGIITDLPNIVPSSVSFRIYHGMHHAYFGDPRLDPDIPTLWEARLVGNGTVRKAIWLFLFPFVQALRPLKLPDVKFATPWTIASWGAAIAYNVAIFYLFGPVALLYLFASFYFSIGFHPVGARWIQEHYLVAPPQETYSYYGPLNVIQLNIGYHNEHHDVPTVAWNRLPALKRMAPEFYEPLVAHRSWLRLIWRFLTDKNLSPWSRVVHDSRGSAPVTAGAA
jgi:sphingolipid delta-4 desaturase